MFRLCCGVSYTELRSVSVVLTFDLVRLRLNSLSVKELARPIDPCFFGETLGHAIPKPPLLPLRLSGGVATIAESSEDSEMLSRGYAPGMFADDRRPVRRRKPERYFLCEGDLCEKVVDARLLPSEVSSSSGISGISDSSVGSLMAGMESESRARSSVSRTGSGFSVRVVTDTDRGSAGWKVALVGVLADGASRFSEVSPSVSLSSSRAASSSRMVNSPGAMLGVTSTTMPGERRGRTTCGVGGAARLDAGAVAAGVSVTLR